MLNISPNSIISRLDTSKYSVFSQAELPPANRMFRNWLVGTFTILLLLLLTPWTQNVQMKGKLTTLQPDQRPQTIHSTIAGRIEKWYVREGQLIKRGDTIVYLSEIKADYFDPQLVDRAGLQLEAKEGAVESYARKVGALEDQLQAMEQELAFKQSQLKNKIRQSELKVESEKAAVEQARVNYDIAIYQYNRTDTLFQKGIKSLSDLEGKRIKMQSTKAKLIATENKLLESQNELEITKLTFNTLANEYAAKMAKTESDKFSTLSNRFDAEGSVNKLRNTYENYARRSSFYYITAPQDCYVTKALKPGIGETLKEGEALVSIMPANYELAVELFIRPMDLPLLNIGEEVRFIFDGWPAIVFNGWPNMSFGTFSGDIVAVDQMTSENGLYRLLVGPNDIEKPWPKALRVGSGAEGIALLKRVPLWYELWRQLNGFPPEFTESMDTDSPKMKAPIKSVK
ncbi:MAG: biotin/lipoyl-binding protein [Bacteroidota bacterium]